MASIGRRIRSALERIKRRHAEIFFKTIFIFNTPDSKVRVLKARNPGDECKFISLILIPKI